MIKRYWQVAIPAVVFGIANLYQYFNSYVVIKCFSHNSECDGLPSSNIDANEFNLIFFAVFWGISTMPFVFFNKDLKGIRWVIFALFFILNAKICWWGFGQNEWL